MNDIYKIKVDNVDYIVDDISYEYSQLDSNDAGRTEDGTMYRDVIGLTNKVSCEFKNRDNLKGTTLSSILKLIEKTSCSFYYYDIKESKYVTKNMYIVSDKVSINVINNEIIAQPFQIRFIQMNVDEV